MSDNTTQPADLSSYIDSQPVVAAPENMSLVSDEVTPEAPTQDETVQGADASTGGDSTQADQPPVEQQVAQPQGVTTQEQQAPDPRVAELEARERAVHQQQAVLRQNILRTANDRIKAEERAFHEALTNMDDAERQQTVAAYQDRQLRTQNQFLNSQLTQIQRAQYERENESAKGQVAFLMAQKFGIPFEGEYRDALLTAQSANDMQRVGNAISGLFRQNSVNNAIRELSDQIESGAFVAGGAGQSSPPPSKTKVGSGDLSGYLSERSQYQVIPHVSPTQ